MFVIFPSVTLLPRLKFDIEQKAENIIVSSPLTPMLYGGFLNLKIFQSLFASFLR